MTDANYWGINGEIFSGIGSGNKLIVAVRDFDGSDFSVLNPLVQKIGNTPRVLDSFLRVEVLAGVNTFNAGGTELATKEIDYFVYLGWRTSNSSMFILVSRIPYAITYGDFSGTATNEKYGAFSGTTPASTDPVVNIGRFNAVNSGTASFNWSIPAASIIINRPIYETRWLSYTPVVTASSGTITTVGAVLGSYIVTGRSMGFDHQGNITTNGTGAAGVRVSLPFTPPASKAVFSGRENTVTGAMLQGRVGANYIEYIAYNNIYPGGDGRSIIGGGGLIRLV